MRSISYLVATITILLIAASTTLYLWFSEDAPAQSIQTSLASSSSAESGTGSDQGQSTSASTEQPLPSGPANSSDWTVLTLFAMALTCLLSTATSFYLYYWRKILLSNPHLIIPEQQAKWVHDLGQHAHRLGDMSAAGIDFAKRLSMETQQTIEKLSETFMTMQKALDERDHEIQRLKRGYDADIFRKFLIRFIRVDQAVEDLKDIQPIDKDQLEQLSRLLSDAFAECNVEIFEPSIGDDYRTAYGVADHPRMTKSENPEDAFKIAEVTERGYLIRGAESVEVILPAKVRIFELDQGSKQ